MTFPFPFFLAFLKVFIVFLIQLSLLLPIGLHFACTLSDTSFLFPLWHEFMDLRPS